MGRVLHTTENIRKHNSLDNRGQFCPGLDEDPGPLASGSLEFLARSDASDVGVSADAGDVEDIHDYTDDGNQQRVQGRVKKNNEATRQSELHS